MRVSSAWMKNIAEGQDKMEMKFGTAQEESSFGRAMQKTTTITPDVQEKGPIPNVL